MDMQNRNSKIKVLHIGADNIGYGGRSVIAFNLTQNMSSERIKNDFLSFKKIDRNYEEMVEQRGGKIQYILELPYRRRRVNYETTRFREMAHIIRENNYDIIHIHADHAYEAMKSIFAVWISGRKCRIVVHAHTTGNDEKNFLLKRMMIRLCQTMLPLCYDAAFACSAEAAHYLFGESVKHFKVINNGIELERYRYDEGIREKVRKDFKLKNRFVVGSVGRLAPPKNPFFLLDVFVEYRKLNSSAVLMLVGEGPLRREIEKHIEELKISDAVLLLGNRSDVPDLLQAMDVFVLTSIYEGFGIVNIEAQAAGLPCLVSDVVPREAKVNDDFCFMPLKAGCLEWAKKIMDLSGRKRESDLKKIEGCGFDIKNNAFCIEQEYCHLMDE